MICRERADPLRLDERELTASKSFLRDLAGKAQSQNVFVFPGEN